MAKARPIYVACEGLDDASHIRIELVLKDEHGAHGLKFLGDLAMNEVEPLQPDLDVKSDKDTLIEIVDPGNPSKWITSNPFVSDLCRRYPQYGNMIRFLCNERGLFLKVGNHANQRAYWNSTLNGGLPTFKKADPVHEGTFMLHDFIVSDFIPMSRRRYLPLY